MSERTGRQAVGIGVIGAGAMGRHHLRLLAGHGVHPVAVADAAEPALDRVRAEWPSSRCYLRHEELLADPHVDLVDIVLPHHLHARIARDALRAGKHVLVEKPPAVTLAEFDDLVAVAGHSGRRLLVKAYQRSSEFTDAVRRECRPGRLGGPRMIDGHFESRRLEILADAADWRTSWTDAGGGVLFDTGYHFLDWVLHLFGRARSVSATCWGSTGRPRGRPEDHASVVLELCSGPIATFTCSWAAATGPPRWRRVVTCENGSIEEWDARDRAELTLTSGGRTTRISRAAPWDQANGAALLEVVDAVRTGRPSVFDAVAARDTLGLLLTCYRSSERGRRMKLDGYDFGHWRPDAACLAFDRGPVPAAEM